MDYAMAGGRGAENELNRTIYATEIERYVTEKQAYISTFDNVQSMADGVFKLDYRTSDFVHALEKFYLLDNSRVVFMAVQDNLEAIDGDYQKLKAQAAN